MDVTMSLTSEEFIIARRLMLASARIESRSQPAELPQDESNWKAIIPLIQSQGMLPLVSRYCSRYIPPSETAILSLHYAANMRRNLMMTGDLLGLLAQFEEGGVEVLPYKGPVLAEVAYGNLALREFADLDLLIRRESLTAALRLMVDLGYQPEPLVEISQLDLFSRYCNVIAFRHREKGLTVEIHWALSPGYLPFELTFDHLLRRAIVVSPGGRPVRTFSNEDLLLYLCFHGSKHGWERLAWIGDIGHLLYRHQDLDWDYLQWQVAEQNANRLVLIAVLLASAVTGNRASPLIDRICQPDEVASHLAASIVPNLPNPYPSLTQTARFLLQVRSTLTDKLHFVLRLLSTPSAADWFSSPRLQHLNYLLPVMRPFRLLARSL